MIPGMPADARKGGNRTGLMPTFSVGLTLLALAAAFMFFAH